MIPSILAIIISLALAFGHIWWGIQHPLKELQRLGNPTKVVASYHACWYHISIIFLASASVIALSLFQGSVWSQTLWVLWAIIFGCWITYLVVVYRYPSMRKLGWGQIVLILVLLVNLGIVACETTAA